MIVGSAHADDPPVRLVGGAINSGVRGTAREHVVWWDRGQRPAAAATAPSRSGVMASPWVFAAARLITAS